MVDYSKWNNIEISDDEEARPNAEGPSFSRGKYQNKDEIMQKHKKEIEDYQKRMFETKEKILKLQQVLKELEEQNEMHEKLCEKLMKQKQKLSAGNADTISKPGFSKTLINASSSNQNFSKQLGFLFLGEMKTAMFFIEHEKELKHYGILSEYEDSRAYLKAHNYLLCEDSVFSLLEWCMNLEMTQELDLIECILHQMICLQHILNNAKVLNLEPVAIVDIFFAAFRDPAYRTRHQEKSKKLTKEIVEGGYVEIRERLKSLETFNFLEATFSFRSPNSDVAKLHKMTFIKKD